MTGRRVYPSVDGELRLAEGDYGRDGRGHWYCWPPATPEECCGILDGHQVTEHEDGTITVSPSIFIEYTVGVLSGEAGPRTSWHGFLERGVWRAA